ncbi:hypothetical protein LTR67_008537 [Exophiala xenobiotica]
MHFLKVGHNGELTLAENLNPPPSRYAILSHTWGRDDEEITYDEMKNGLGATKVGYQKLRFCADRAGKDGIDYVWVDTCCINKANWTELAEAINSMYRWYRDAAKCYVYLSDVSVQTWVSNFETSRWFRRGWTLQELLAPTLVEFYSHEGVYLGDKGSLELQIHRATSIPVAALRGNPLSDFARLEEEIKKSSTSESLTNTRDPDSCQRLESKAGLRCVKEAQAGPYAPFLDVLLQLAEVPDDDRTREAVLQCARLLGMMDGAKFLWEHRDAVDKKTVKATLEAEEGLRDTYCGAVARCYKSLGFDDIMAREEIIAAPDDETCLWIYDAPEFESWHSNQKPLLWLKGKPGSGKSILMKSLFKRREKDLDDSSTILLRFFFNGRGSPMEKPPEALYRTLTQSMMRLDPATLCAVLAYYLEKESRTGIVRWRTEELADFFHKELEQPQKKDVEVFVDALDECSDSEVLEVIRRFEKSIQKPRGQSKLRICWSSRFYPNISLRAVQAIELIVSDQNAQDIREHVRNIFPLHLDERLRSLSEDVISRAQGVFLWASLAAKKLMQAFDAGRDMDDLVSILQSIPGSLGQYFLKIFTDTTFTQEQRKDLYDIALLVLGSLRPLSIDELHSALLLANTNTKWSLDTITLSSGNLGQFRKRLMHASGGLIEVVERDTLFSSNGGLSSRVQVIHESVREFLLGEGLSVLNVSSTKAFAAEGHSVMVRAAFKGLIGIQTDFTRYRHGQNESGDPSDDNVLDALIPAKTWRPPSVSFVLDYVRDHCFSHLTFAAEAQTEAQDGSAAADLPCSSVSREALFAYLRLACSEVIRHGTSRASVNEQLQSASLHPSVFGFEKQELAQVLDLPNQLMTASEFLKRRGLYLFEEPPATGSLPFTMHRFLAVFVASFRSNGGMLASSPSSKTKQSTPNQSSAEVREFHRNRLSLPLEENTAEPSCDPPANLHFGISFLLPHPTAPRVMLPQRFQSPNPHDISREDAVLAVDIGDWSFVASNAAKLKPYLTSPVSDQLGSHLTFSNPSTLSCILFYWPLDDSEVTLSNGEPVPFRVQEGDCQIGWRPAQGASDRATLFPPLTRPEASDRPQYRPRPDMKLCGFTGSIRGGLFC